MDCNQTRTHLHAYLDGETEPKADAAVGHHLETCPCCREEYLAYQQLGFAVRRDATYHSAPERLAHRIASALPATTTPAPTATAPGSMGLWSSWLSSRWAASFASFLLISILSSGMTYYLTVPDQKDVLAQEVVGAHVRSLMADHLTDVTSADQHTVKPWFNGRVDVAPPVKDFAAEGYPLVGGRLDYLDDRPVAALIYRHDRHLINVFMWPTAAGEIAPPATLVRQGYNLLHWQHSGLAFWAISDLNADALNRFVSLMQQEEPKSGAS
jgi:anti-sigma factor (TIGR02949 family)